MLMLVKLVRKAFKQLKSDLTPAQIGVGVFFGALWGLTPMGLHWAALFLLALLLNCSMAAMLFVGGLLKPVGMLLGTASFSLGFKLLEGGGPHASLIAALADAPVLAFLGYERYVVAGGYALAFPSAVVLALFARAGVGAFRRVYAARMEDAAWYGRVTKNALSRFLVNYLFGKHKDFVERKPRFLLLRPFRPYMAVFVPLLAVALTIGGGLYAQAAIGGLAAGAASRALGVEVTFGKIDYSFFGQSLVLERFQLPDPGRPTENLLAVGRVEADLGFLELLRGRLQVEKLAVSDVATRVARESDGTLNVSKLKAAQPKEDAPAGEQAAWKEYLTWVSEKSKDQDWNQIWTKYQEYRAKAAKAREEEAAKPKVVPPPPDFDAALAWERPRTTPRIRVDEFRISNVRLDVTERGGKPVTPAFTGFEIAGTDLSMRPGWNGKPFAFAASGKLADGASGTLKADLRIGASGAEGKVDLEGAPVADWKALYVQSLPVGLERGTLAVGLGGKTESGRIEAAAGLRLERFAISPKPGETRILGLDPRMSAYAIQGLNAYGEKLPLTFGATLAGRLDAPELSCELGLLEAAKQGLEMLGRKELDEIVAQFGARVDAVRRSAPQVERLYQAPGQAVEALQKGDTKAVQETIEKARTDVKELPAAKEDAKKELEKAKESIEGLKGLFKKKDEKKP